MRKTTGRYFFDTKKEMNDWIVATTDEHIEQAEIENDLDFHMLINCDDIDVYYAEFNGYFSGIDDTEWPENASYQVIV